MLDDLYEDSVNHLEQEFYSKDFKFSYSSLCKLIFSPAIFYQLYILGHKEEKTEKHLIEGSVIHCLLLDQKSFDKQFIVSPINLPSGNSKTLVDKVFFKAWSSLQRDPDLKFEDFEQNILDTMSSINYYQNINKDADRLKKVITLETNNYFEFLKKRQGKTILDEETLKYCQDSVEIIKMDNHICDLLGLNPDSFQDIEVFNEKYLEVSMKGKPFGFKGFLDNIKIDHNKKVIYINDFKTSGKSLKEFKDSVEFYSYWLQATIYYMLVTSTYYHLLEKDYSIEFHFIVIDKYFNVYPFPVSRATRDAWIERFKTEILPVAEYHYTLRKYDLPYEFDTNSVVL